MDTPPLQDRFGRKVTYLRVSVTDRCNFRCIYCMPEEGTLFEARPELLTAHEIEHIAKVFAQGGVRKVRITGGEPLIRQGIVEIVARLSALHGIDHVAMTTNAFLLKRKAHALLEAGLTSLNISLDTLDPAKFRTLSRTGTLKGVLEGIDAAQAAGFEDIKLNAVVIRGLNDQDLPDLLAFAASKGLILRLIEFMPIGTQTLWGNSGRASCVSAHEMRALLGSIWRLEEDSARYGAGPARYQRAFGAGLPEEGARVGIISAVTECFCGDCNRLRLSATGGLRGCLADDNEIDLRDIVRAQKGDVVALRRAIDKSLEQKRAEHTFDLDASGVTSRAMNAIGG